MRWESMSSTIDACCVQKTCFAVQLDESTLPNNDSLLLCYVRYVKEQEIHEELLFARILKADTKGETVYNTFKEYLSDKGIPLSNIMSAAVDGAPPRWLDVIAVFLVF